MKMKKLAAFIILAFGVISCDLFNPDNITDPNNPSVGSVAQNASQGQLQNLLSGLEIRHRNSTADMMSYIGSFGREVYQMNASEPRALEQPLGLEESADLENSGTGGAWAGPYSAVKQSNLLIQSVQNTDNINEQQKNGFLGVAQTLKAFQYLIPLLTHKHSTGIRIDVDNPLQPGPFVPFKKALSQIRDLLDEADNNLQQAGNVFNFELTDGYSEFNTPPKFINLNRAIAARTAIYDKDWEGALQALEAAKPFFDLKMGASVLNKGAYFVYSGPPGSFNPYYYPRNANTSDIVMVATSMIEDAEPNDKRVKNKFFKRNEPVVQLGLSPQYQDNRFDSNTSPLPWLRNEELILIYAEANAQLKNTAKANKAINIIRNTWGLTDFTSSDKNEIIDQILHERRYSLWVEFGHRWIDAKRYNRLDQLPKIGGKIWQYIGLPSDEINWEDTH